MAPRRLVVPVVTGDPLLTDGYLLLTAVGLAASVLVLLVGLVLAGYVAWALAGWLRRRRDTSLDRHVTQALSTIAPRTLPDQLGVPTQVIRWGPRPAHRPPSTLSNFYLSPEDLRE